MFLFCLEIAEGPLITLQWSTRWILNAVIPTHSALFFCITDITKPWCLYLLDTISAKSLGQKSLSH